MEIPIGKNSDGLDVTRELESFDSGVIEPIIKVKYREHIYSPTGNRLNTLEKYYICVDIQSVTQKGNLVLVTPEVKDEEGNITIDAVFKQESDIIITPARLSYTKWKKYIIPQEWVGKEFGDDLLLAKMRYTLSILPVDVPNNYCV